MTITSSSSSLSDKSEKKKKNKSLLVSTIVKDEFASSSKNKIFGQEQESIATKHETLKKNHEKLKTDYENLEKRVKHEEETYDAMRNHQKTKTEELMATNIGLFDDIERAKSDKEKYKKMFEEMKSIVSERKAEIEKLKKKSEELLTLKCKGLEQADIIEKRCLEIAERFDVVEADCSYLKSLKDAKIAASGNVMSKIVETCSNKDHNVSKNVTNDVVISKIVETCITNEDHNVSKNVTNDVAISKIVETFTTNEDHNMCKNVTDVVMISDESDAEYDRNKEQCKKTRHSSNVTYSLISSPSSSSSSSSSSGGYFVEAILPDNWPEWAKP